MKLQFIFLALALILTQSCTNNNNVEPDNTPNLRTLSANEIQVSASNETFAFNLFRKIHENKDDNIFISPISISTALGMVLNGAEGETKAGILETINYGGLQPADVSEGYKDLSSLLKSMDKKVILSLANSVWYRNNMTINPDFANTVKTNYDAVAQGLDFSSTDSKDIINDWVDNHTNHKIENLIEEIPSDAIMYLINATYFKGEWNTLFEKSKTKKDIFHKIDGSTTQVDMMATNEGSFQILVNDQLTMVDLPYGNGQFSMTILMPENDNSVSKIIESLSSDYFNNILAQMHETNLEFQMPRFKMSSKNSLNDVLSDLGMSTAFSENASFPYLFSGANQFTITNVIHQATIEVNEEGAEAAAATAVEVGVTSVGLPKLITINRPFLFIIIEKHTKAILFIGEMLDPSAL